MRIFPLTLALTILLLTPILAGCSSQQNRSDALKAADRIHAYLKKQDFASIYRESSDSFKQEGEESKFVESMRAVSETAGTLKEAKPVAYQETIDSNVGKQHVLIFDLEFERARGRERLLFTRTNRGEMQLSDIVIEPVS